MSADNDTLEAQVRCLENENRALRMTLRDQFAMGALPSTMGSESMRPSLRLAEIAYRWADAMLEARTK